MVTAGEIRKPNKIRKILDKLSNTQNLRAALELIVGLQGKTFLEEAVAIEYDRKTGKPVRYGWEPLERFGTDFEFGGEGEYVDVKIRLTNGVISELKKGPFLFVTNGKKYVAKFEARDNSGDDRDGHHSGVNHLVYLSELKDLGSLHDKRGSSI